MKFREQIMIECDRWTNVNFNLLTLNIDISAVQWCYRKLPSFNAMVFSFKPLKYKYWMDDGDIRKLLMI